MDGFDAYKVERGDEIVEFSLDDDSQESVFLAVKISSEKLETTWKNVQKEMEIIQTGSIFPTASPSSSQSGRQLSKTYPKGRSRVEILPNDDERVVRAGTWCGLFFFILKID